MKTPIPAILISMFLLSACNDKPEPMPVAPRQPVAPVQAAPVAAPPFDFPIEEHSMKSLKVFDILNSEVSYVVTVGNPTRVFELLGGSAPPETDLSPRHGVEFADLHPSRLTAIGFDPEKPTGLAIQGQLKKPTESSIWAVFGSLADEDTFKKAFNLRKKDENGVYSAGEGDRRIFIVMQNDEVVIASRPDMFKPEGTMLSADPMFVKLRDALDYGELATAYVNIKRGKALYGVGFDEVGLGVKVFADSELQAGTVRIKFAELPASLDPQVPYLDRAIELKAELHPSGRALRTEIDAITVKPKKRRTAASRNMLQHFDEAGELNTIQDGLAIAGRVWSVTQPDIARAYQEWQDLGLSFEEKAQLAELEKSMASIETVDEIDQAAIGQEVGDNMRNLVTSANKNSGMGGITDMMGKLGGMMSGGGGKGGKGGKGGGKGMLGGLGGMLGGGGGSDAADIKVTSSNRYLRSHIRSKARTLALCWANHRSAENFTVIANVEIAPVTGKLKLTRLRNAPKTMDACLKKIISGQIKPADPPPPPEDPNEPVEPPKPEKATLKLTFTRS